MKKCTKCGEVSDNFTPNKSTISGLGSRCRKCHQLICKEYSQTKNGLILKMISSQRGNSKKRNHKAINYTLEEFRNWCLSQRKFHKLYNNWKKSGFRKELVPSCDRTDDSKGYSLDRLQLLTWAENKAKAEDDMRKGKIKHGFRPQKPVEQRNLDGELIKTHVSSSEAERATGVHQSSISFVCNGNQKTAGGFLWNFPKK